MFCRRAFALDPAVADAAVADFWPDPALEPPFRELCRAQERLILPVMRAILTYLGCDPHLYDRRLTGTNFGLRLNYYPALSEADRSSGARSIGCSAWPKRWATRP